MQLFLVRLKYLLRSKGNIFWTFGFPLVLGTFFYLAFGQLTEDSFINTSDLYVVTDDEELINFLTQLESDEGVPLYHVKTDKDLDKLEQALKEQTITGYIYTENSMIIYRINDNGLAQTITKSVLDQYVQMTDLIITIQQTEPSKLPNVIERVQKPIFFLSEPYSKTDSKASRLIIYFYSLLASQAIWGSFWGIGLVSDLQANMSTRGIRLNISPTHKIKLIVIHFLAALLIHFAGSLLLLFYLKVILGVSFGEQTGLIILAQLIGSIAGISLGALLASLIRGSTNTREAIISLISTFLGFLSGLMSIYIKYLIDKHAPIIRWINPVSLLTDAFYSLYYYQDQIKFFQNLGILTLLSLLFVMISYLRLRRTKYDSI